MWLHICSPGTPGFSLSLFKWFQGQSTVFLESSFTASSSTPIVTLLGLDFEQHFPLWKTWSLSSHYKGQVSITFWSSMSLNTFSMSFLNQSKTVYFPPKRKEMAYCSSWLSLSLFSPTVLQLLMEVYVSTCLFWVTDYKCSAWEANCCSYSGNEEH